MKVNEMLKCLEKISHLVAKTVVAEGTTLPHSAQGVAGADGVEVVHPTDPAV